MSVGARGKVASELTVVLPNLRDLAVSAGLQGRVKQRVLWRAARNFARRQEQLWRVMCDKLNVRCVIDLRDDDLTAEPQELFSRQLVARCYGRALPVPPNESIQPRHTRRHHPTTDGGGRFHDFWLSFYEPDALSQETSVAQSAPEENEYGGVDDNVFDSGEEDQSGGGRHIAEDRPSTPQSVCEDLRSRRLFTRSLVAPSPVQRPTTLQSRLAFERQIRKMIVINMVESPEVKQRVKEELRRNLLAAPALVGAKLWDLVNSKSKFSNWLFCRLIISQYQLIDTYVEMFKFCRQNICSVLKTISIAPQPALFHCTLGKDRTGVIAMLLLSVLGCDDLHIAADYAATQEVGDYFQAFVKDFIVKQSGLDEGFCQAPPSVALDSLRFLREHYGSVSCYLDHIGFDFGWRTLLRRRYLEYRDEMDFQTFNKLCEDITLQSVEEAAQRHGHR